jgi:hypothetical protein
MESLIFSNQGLKDIDSIDIELRKRSKDILYLDLSKNYLE